MKELSLHILDVAQNSLAAGATLVEISLLLKDATLTVTIADNGRGMPPELAKKAADPFVTTRATRRVGLGLALWKQAAEQAGGTFSLDTAEGKGTIVTASFQAGHIDTPPLGEMADTLVTLVQGAPDVDFVYRQGGPGNLFIWDTRELRKTLTDVPLSEPDVLAWLGEYLREQLGLHVV